MSERIELGGTKVTVLVDAAASGGAVTVLELELQPGARAGPHRHTREDETIVVFAGELSVDGRTLGAGEAVFLARGVRHSFANDGDVPMRAHVVCTPAGLEEFFRAIAAGDDPDQAGRRAGLEFG